MAGSLVTRLHHVSLVVADTQRSLQFFEAVLGLRALTDRPAMAFNGAWLDLGEGQQIHLLEVPNPDPLEGRPEHGGRDRHVALNVRHICDVESRLQGLKIPYTQSASGRQALFFRDPDGNTFEVLPSESS